MPAWDQLLNHLNSLQTPDQKDQWLKGMLNQSLSEISAARGGKNVIFYFSAFLQKPQLPPPSISLAFEEINGFMTVMHGMDWEKNLTLILHTPGGVTNAAETIVEYLHTKFTDIDVIIPTYAMSAGTMIAMGANNIVMGRQSQLGPIDPQLPHNRRMVSARAITGQFHRAKEDLENNVNLAHVWAPILQSLGPALLQEAEDAFQYSEDMVVRWMERRMFSGNTDANQKATEIAKHFGRGEKNASHGRRIDREEAKLTGLPIENLETNSPLQESLLTAYHLLTILIESTAASKLLVSNAGKMWVKNHGVQQQPNIQPIQNPAPRR